MNDNNNPLRHLLRTLPLCGVLVASAWALGGCDESDSDEPGEITQHRAGDADFGRAPAPSPALHPRPPHAKAVGQVAPDAKEAFRAMVDLIDAEYVDGPLSEDELWTGAMEGVMARLIQLHDHQVNALLSPEQLEHLVEGTRGSIVGVGIEIASVADILMVEGIIEGGPAEAAGLAPGDRILAVDGTKLAGLPLGESVQLIRGEQGSKVELFVQRDTEEWRVEIERNVVKVSSVQSELLDPSTGYVAVNSFSENTVADLDAQLAELSARGMTRLILDLRHNPGGLLVPAQHTADRFLPEGARIVSVRGRDGEKHFDAEQSDAFESIPMAVLIGPATASGAEIVAAALDVHGRATLIGEPTIGKGTVEKIHELPNAWAMKLSTSRFFSPDDQPRQGAPVEPAILVPSAAEEGQALGEQAAVKAAVEILQRAG